MSVNIGGTMTFKIKTPATSYHVDIFRVGYYAGLGARKIAGPIRPTATLPQTQPACQTFSDTGLIDCGNWAASASWAVPSTAVSGLYLALLTRDDVAPKSGASGVSQIPFVVRNDASTSAIVVQTSDATWQAYNTYGGNSLYQCTVACPPGNPQGYKAAFKVSYNRPFHSADDDQGRSWYDYAEQPLIRFLEENGYDVSYISSLDTSTQGSLLLNHKTFISSGHDEYWSGPQRANVEAARDAGVNLAFFSGNEVFWKTRWEPSQAGPATANRTLVSYKDTHFNAPTDPVAWTGTWRDPRYGTATGGGNPENSLTGQIFIVNYGQTDITVPAQYAKLRLWRNTAVASLTGSQTVTLGAGLGTLGYEWDVDADDGFRPPGLIDMSSTTFTAPEVFTDYGTNVAPGTQTHHLTLYKAPSGALVFGAGTVQWAWGLDGFSTGKATDKNMQQATINLLADMGAQPATLMSTLLPATSSADKTPPTSVITAPAAGTTVPDGSTVTIKGTASDTGGGIVGGVEVSTDGGTTWHPATGTSAWSYSWVAHGNPATTIKVRATDDSGNIETAPPSVVLTVVCPCSMFGSTTPTNTDSGDATASELGVKFKSDAAGTVTGIRFYKSTANTGTHVGNLWTASGTLLASATFTGESATGWQTVTFSTPVKVTPGTVYVASYFAPKGHYSESAGYMYGNPSPQPLGSASLDSGNLHVLRNVPGTDNGLYKYSSSTTFPTSSYNAENYWVDVNFVPVGPAAPQVTANTPAANATSVAINTKPTVTFDQGVTPASIAFTLKDAGGTTVPGTTSYNAATNTATFTPTASLAYSTNYTATVSGATNATGQALATPSTWSFTTATAPVTPAVSSTNPAANASGIDVAATPSATFNQAVVPASVAFTLTDAGGNAVPGTTSYNATTNTATFTPTATLTYSTNYTATVSGATNATGQSMAAPLSWPFTTRAVPAAPVVSSTAPAAGASSIATNAKPTATFDQAVTAASVAFTLNDAGGNTVPGTTSYNAATNTATFTPTAALAYGTIYTAAVSGATNAAGQTMATAFTWSFTTAAPPPAPSASASTPANSATGVPTNTKPTVTFDQAVTAASITFTLTDAGGNAVPGAGSYNAATNTATFTPTAALAYSTNYTAAVSGATNATGQTMAAPYSWTFTTASASICPCTVFSPTSAPTVLADSDPAGVQLGMKFQSGVPGQITGIRFYKGPQNTGTHTGYLWSGTGSLLASVTFGSESSSGWQEAALSAPVTIAANTTYVVSYYAPNGHYSADANYFATAAVNGPLKGLASGTDGPNGVYRYGDAAFPTSSYGSSNYWVDVDFTASAVPAPAVTSTTPVSNAASVGPSSTITATFNQTVTGATLGLKNSAGTAISGTSSFNAGTNTLTFTPQTKLASGAVYTATAANALGITGVPMASPYVWSFTTSTTSDCPCTVFPATATPGTLSTDDPNAVELGMKFQSDVSGTVTGVRFYKSSDNTGTHTGYLWSGTGSLLASVTFTGETASGWQQANFTTPVQIAANTTYVVSYLAPNGHYSSNSGYFTTAANNAMLHGLAAGTDGPNGVYRYGDAAFPTDSYNSSNYWVDAVFATQ